MGFGVLRFSVYGLGWKPGWGPGPFEAATFQNRSLETGHETSELVRRDLAFSTGDWAPHNVALAAPLFSRSMHFRVSGFSRLEAQSPLHGGFMVWGFAPPSILP